MLVGNEAQSQFNNHRVVLTVYRDGAQIVFSFYVDSAESASTVTMLVKRCLLEPYFSVNHQYYMEMRGWSNLYKKPITVDRRPEGNAESVDKFASLKKSWEAFSEGRMEINIFRSNPKGGNLDLVFYFRRAMVMELFWLNIKPGISSFKNLTTSFAQRNNMGSWISGAPRELCESRLANTINLLSYSNRERLYELSQALLRNQ